MGVISFTMITLIIAYFYSYSSSYLTNNLYKLDKKTSVIPSNKYKRLNSISDDDIPPLKSGKPLRILLLVEPTPFNYVSGYANRFKEMLKYLKLAGNMLY